MKPKRIKSLADLRATIENDTRREGGLTDWKTFVTCQELGVSISAQATLFRVAYGTQLNRVNKYKYFVLRGDTIQS